MQRAAAEEAVDISAPIVSVLIREKLKIDIPQRIYPTEIKIFRLPSLSESAPIKIVVKVATIEEAETISEISAAEAANIL